jgi:hypothetical protein
LLVVVRMVVIVLPPDAETKSGW